MVFGDPHSSEPYAAPPHAPPPPRRVGEPRGAAARRSGRAGVRVRSLLLAAAVAAALSTGGCGGLPRDPEGTLERVRGGTLRVGIARTEPWTNGSAAAPAGIEIDLVRTVASGLDARVEWVAGGESELIERLERHELDLVAAGLEKTTPWGKRVGLTRPYARWPEERREVGRVLAVAPGENGFLLEVERRLARVPVPAPPAGASP